MNLWSMNGRGRPAAAHPAPRLGCEIPALSAGRIVYQLGALWLVDLKTDQGAIIPSRSFQF
jgi:hypothetical protein